MKQTFTLDKKNILNVLRFYESIGINLQTNLHQMETKKDLLELTKHNSKKNKARRAQALLKAQGKESPASRRR